MRKLVVLCIGLLGLTLLVGCGSDGGDEASNGQPAMMTERAVAPAPGLREQSSPPDGGSGGGDSVLTRKEVVTGSIDITADDPIDAAETITAQVQELGGRIDSRTESPGTGEGDPSAMLTVRVPADKTDAFIDGLGGVGEVTRVSTNRDDVTMQWEDLDARIRALRASVERLHALIAQATSTADLIDAGRALSNRQGELDSLVAQQRRLDDQIALSTLTIDITSEHKKSDDEGADNFWDGIVAGWDSLVDWLQDAVVFTGKAIPWIGFVAVLGAVIGVIVGLVRRSGRVKQSSPAGSASGTGTESGEVSAPDGGSSEDQTEQP